MYIIITYYSGERFITECRGQEVATEVGPYAGCEVVARARVVGGWGDVCQLMSARSLCPHSTSFARRCVNVHVCVCEKLVCYLFVVGLRFAISMLYSMEVGRGCQDFYPPKLFFFNLCFCRKQSSVSF